MAWAIVAVVLVAVAGVGWYVLRSTPAAGDLQGTTPAAPYKVQDDPNAIPRGQNVVPEDLTDPAVRARIQAQADNLVRYTMGLH